MALICIRNEVCSSSSYEYMTVRWLYHVHQRRKNLEKERISKSSRINVFYSSNHFPQVVHYYIRTCYRGEKKKKIEVECTQKMNWTIEHFLVFIILALVEVFVFILMSLFLFLYALSPLFLASSSSGDHYEDKNWA